MKIGVTERGDASVDFSWYKKLLNKEVDGCILITKNINEEFINKVLAINNIVPVIVHCTCTGWGGTLMEPNVPQYTEQLYNLKLLISRGFSRENCVLRIDPIFPTEKGLKRVCDVIDYAYKINILPHMRIRVSVFDEYSHVKDRFIKAGFHPMYGDRFYATPDMFTAVRDTLGKYDLHYETCAEPFLTDCNYISTGCVSEKDIKIFGLPMPNCCYENGQNRNGCKCLTVKTEMLSSRHRCVHNCLYCYWKD